MHLLKFLEKRSWEKLEANNSQMKTIVLKTVETEVFLNQMNFSEVLLWILINMLFNWCIFLKQVVWKFRMFVRNFEKFRIDETFGIIKSFYIFFSFIYLRTFIRIFSDLLYKIIKIYYINGLARFFYKFLNQYFINFVCER